MMRVGQKVQDLARQWADQRGLTLDKLDPAQREGLVRDLAAEHELPPASIRAALLAQSGEATEAAGAAFSSFQADASAPTEMEKALRSGSPALIAMATAQALASGGAGVAGIVGLQAALGTPTKDE